MDGSPEQLIEGRHNPTFKLFLSLIKARGIKKHGLALLSGRKYVEEILREFPERCAGIVIPGDQEVPIAHAPSSIRRYRLDQKLFSLIDTFGTGQVTLLVKVNPLPPWAPSRLAPGCTLCIPFQEPGNVGTVIRSAAAFGVPEVVMLREAAHPYHPKSLRAAGSAVFRVTMYEGPSLCELTAWKEMLIALSPDGEDIGAFRFPPAFCLVPGLEGSGIPPELKGVRTLSIPMEETVESLNAALATGIALYAWRSRWSKTRPRV
jgi:tRNA G18 (ribose-2'-O)-methylase SpoU